MHIQEHKHVAMTNNLLVSLVFPLTFHHAKSLTNFSFLANCRLFGYRIVSNVDALMTDLSGIKLSLADF